MQADYCKLSLSPAQREDNHWKVKRVFKGETLVSKYQEVLSENRSADDESNIDHQHCQRTIRQLKEQNRQV